jgi:riboflavin kinase / FMN adenylyltransferase
MKVWNRLEGEAQNFQGGVVTVGNFDGLHLGHQALLQKARGLGSPRVLITFDPHPAQVLYPERALKRIFPREDLVEQLPRYGVDLLLILPFDHSFAQLSAQEFLRRFVYDPFRPRHIVAGYDFHFGNQRAGTLELLQNWTASHHAHLEVVPAARLGSEIVSSRRIRECIVTGDVGQARQLLGRPFYLRGEVIKGAGRGSQLGIPTLNQRVENETLPPYGVYASRAIGDGFTHPSVTNIGTNPTFESRARAEAGAGAPVKVETHVLDGNVSWFGKVIDVQLFERLRDEKKFSSIEDLKKQIQSDILKSKVILSTIQE